MVDAVHFAGDANVSSLLLFLGTIHLVDVCSVFQSGNGDLVDVTDAEIRVQQRLELKGLIAVISDDNAGSESIRRQGDAVDEGEGEGPELFGLVGDGGLAKAKVELDRGVGLTGRLCRRLAQEIPSRVAGETVLGKLGCGLMVRRRAEDLS